MQRQWSLFLVVVIAAAVPICLHVMCTLRFRDRLGFLWFGFDPVAFWWWESIVGTISKSAAFLTICTVGTLYPVAALLLCMCFSFGLLVLNIIWYPQECVTLYRLQCLPSPTFVCVYGCFWDSHKQI